MLLSSSKLQNLSLGTAGTKFYSFDLFSGPCSTLSDCAGRVEDLPPTITVEIKPKWGCLPTAGTISEENNIKKHVSRFSMHQHLKLKQSKVCSLSFLPHKLMTGTM
jgi:hypothetical protein